VVEMGNPTILSRKDLKFIWRCKDCNNTYSFEEEWAVEIIQDLKNREQEINLAESINIRCKECNSYNIEEIEIK
jgi:phage FluMu protein Com